MRREDLLAKGYTEEQATELLNLFHGENNEIKAQNQKLQQDLNVANNTITNLSKFKTSFEELQKSQMSEQEKYEAMKKETEKNLAESKIIVNTAKAKTIVAELGEIDEDIINSLVTEDLEKTEANAKALVNLIKNRDENVAKKTKETLLNANVLPPNPSNVQGGGANGNKEMTKEEFKKLPIVEKNKIFKENKELWNKMTN